MLNHDIYRMEREIETNGEVFDVMAEEPNGRQTIVVSFRGVFHVSQGFHNESVSDATVTHAKGEPMILCMLEDIEGVKREQFLYKNGKRYDITDINDVGGYGKIADISLEVVIDGTEQY